LHYLFIVGKEEKKNNNKGITQLNHNKLEELPSNEIQQSTNPANIKNINYKSDKHKLQIRQI